ncbi:MAG: DUF748 domain-containing protein [Desulfocapsaceae bacterium]|nr:DUF748 domain-containing protein [Desulfocapsaceae bacterium]
MTPTIRKVLTSKYLVLSVAAILLYALVGFIIAPRIIRWYAPKYIQQDLHCLAEIDRVRINPFSLSFEIDGFSLKQADGAPLAAFEKFFVKLKPSSLFHWAVVLKEMDLVQPVIHLVIEADGAVNFEKLVPPAAPQPAPAKPDGKLFPFHLQKALIQGGKIILVDKGQSTPAAFTLQGLDLSLQNISTIRDYNAAYHLAATTEDGALIQWDGSFSLHTLSSEGSLSLKGVEVADIWNFVRDRTNLEQPAGQIDLSLSYRLHAAATPVQLTLEGVHFSGAGLSLKLLNGDKSLIKLNKISIDVPRFDLAGQELHVGTVQLEEGAVDLRIDDAGDINLEKIVRASVPDTAHQPPPPAAGPGTGPQDAAHQPPPPAAAAVLPFKAQVDSIVLKNIAFDLDDISRKNEIRAVVAGLDLHLQAGLEVGAGTNTMTIRNIASEIKGISLSSPSLAGEPLFATEKLSIEGGDCDLAARSITFDRIALSKGTLDVGRDAGGEIAWQQLFEPKGAVMPAKEMKQAKGTKTAGEMKSGSKGKTAGKQAPDPGRGPVAKKTKSLKKAPVVEPAPGVLQDPNSNAAQGGKPVSDTAPAWKFLVKSFEIEDFSSRFTDLTTHSDKPLIGLQGINVKLTEVDGKSPMGFSIGLQMEHGGTVKVNGTVNPLIPSVEADISLAGVVLTSLQPYIDPFVTLKLQSASVSAQGNLRYGIPGDPQEMAYQGSFSFDNLNLVDSASKKTYLRWGSIQLPKFKATLAPNTLEAQEVKILKPVGELIISVDRSLNFDKVLKKKTDQARPVARTALASPAPAKAVAPGKTEQKDQKDAFAYHISRILVEGGDLIFADLSLRPRFTTRIHDLKGTISGLASLKDSEAKILLDGHVDQFGMAKINGTLRPNEFKQYSDIELVFRNIEMKNMSPYSGKFAGRLIESGKFSADLKYTIKEGKMIGNNKIIIDNFVLGQQVDEPGAANLPLDLAIALLKDSNGRIDIGLPVTGDLDDPQFSIGPLIWTMVTNLITKAVTAPFHLLGSMFGGDTEKFDAVEFDPGSAELLPPEKEKLQKLAEALKNRPQLKLVIQGRYSPEVDGRELKDLGIRMAVAARLGTKLGPGNKPVPLDFTDSGTQSALEKLYKERFGRDAMNDLEKGLKEGTIKPLAAESPDAKGAEAAPAKDEGLKLYRFIPGGKSPQQSVAWAKELNSRLVDGEKIPDQTYQQLAQSRAQAIAANLEGEAQVPKDKVSSKDPEALSGDEHPSASLSLDVL